jgi:hypothetical protein
VITATSLLCGQWCIVKVWRMVRYMVRHNVHNHGRRGLKMMQPPHVPHRRQLEKVERKIVVQTPWHLCCISKCGCSSVGWRDSQRHEVEPSVSSVGGECYVKRWVWVVFGHCLVNLSWRVCE